MDFQLHELLGLNVTCLIEVFKWVFKNKFSNVATMNWAVPQQSIRASLLFLIYVYHISQHVDCDPFLYADDSCLIYPDRDVKEIKQKLNKTFSDICYWFVSNKIRIHFRESETKSILFGIKKKRNRESSLDIRGGTIHTKRYKTATILVTH